MKHIEFGNVSINLDNFRCKTKTEFLRKFSDTKYKFDKIEAWKELRKHIPEDK